MTKSGEVKLKTLGSCLNFFHLVNSLIRVFYVIMLILSTQHSNAAA